MRSHETCHGAVFESTFSSLDCGITSPPASEIGTEASTRTYVRTRRMRMEAVMRVYLMWYMAIVLSSVHAVVKCMAPRTYNRSAWVEEQSSLWFRRMMEAWDDMQWRESFRKKKNILDSV
jgi:hypothetical protein